MVINVADADFLQGQPAQIAVELSGGCEALSLSGHGWKEDPGYYSPLYFLEVPALAPGRYTATIRATEACGGSRRAVVCDAEGNAIDASSRNANILIPIEYAPEDVAALKAIAEANPLSKDLRDFIDRGDYLKDRVYNYDNQGYNVGVTWSTETPSRVSSFFVDDGMTRTVSEMDLSALTGLEELSLMQTRLKSLDLSKLTRLNQLNLNGGNGLTWLTVKLPDPLPEYFNVVGYTYVSAGIPVDDYHATTASGTEIELSAYASVEGEKSAYQWYSIVRNPYKRTEVSMEAVSGKEGAFILKGKPGEIFCCEILNEVHGVWSMLTPEIKIARGSADYAQADIDGLRKLAADNPKVTRLREFVDSKGWEHENWETYGDAVATDWNTENRLTGLRIRLDRSERDTISSLDLSAFTELVEFECERWMNINELDLSKNTKLRRLSVFSWDLSSLDLSHCPNLEYFRFGTLSTIEYDYLSTRLTRLDLSGCTKLRELYLEHTPLVSLVLSGCPNLNRLTLNHCLDLKAQGLEKATALSYVDLSFTSQFGD